MNRPNTDEIRFTVRPEHLKLLRAAYVRWDGSIEYGAPAIDPKRPYGNSDVPDDIRRVLGLPHLSDQDCAELHEQTTTALQIVLRTGTFQAGDYVADRYSREWKPA
jgi:hypothetical protein